MQAWLLWSGTLPTLQTAEAHGQEHTEQPWEGSASRGGFPQLSGGGAASSVLLHGNLRGNKILGSAHGSCLMEHLLHPGTGPSASHMSMH